MILIRTFNIDTAEQTITVTTNFKFFKKSLVKIFKYLMGGSSNDGWNSLTDEVYLAKSYSAITEMVDEFSKGTGTIFSIEVVNDGEILQLYKED